MLPMLFTLQLFSNRVFKFTEGSNTPVLVAGDINAGNTDGTGAAAGLTHRPVLQLMEAEIYW